MFEEPSVFFAWVNTDKEFDIGCAGDLLGVYRTRELASEAIKSWSNSLDAEHRPDPDDCAIQAHPVALTNSEDAKELKKVQAARSYDKVVYVTMWRCGPSSGDVWGVHARKQDAIDDYDAQVQAYEDHLYDSAEPEDYDECPFDPIIAEIAIDQVFSGPLEEVRGEVVNRTKDATA